MDNAEPIDIRQYSFDQFISFMFARDVPPPGGKRDPWYYREEVMCDTLRVCRYYTRLFLQPTFLLDAFSKVQLEQGFWAIHGPCLNCSAYRIVFDEGLPFPVREQCIRSMYDLFKHFFSLEPLETSGDMWWDSFCYGWHCGNRKREKGGEDLQLQDVLFETLTNILDLDSDFCHGCALHGLGHLHHPDTEELVQRFLDCHPLLTEGQRAYAQAAAKFRVL